ncbi:MAG TPA: epimerase [Caldimonas sp.]|jgi:uncharacterized protein YbjT (DUF2867 family)|nr:epimerase [Caldimonas sp.]HEX2541882.1 epimerase [Caldimonas sp.]
MTAPATAECRVALLVGATGLLGRALLPLLVDAVQVAGSRAAFRAVDLELVVDIARAARARGAARLAVVSAMGADPASRVFYSRVKGEMEDAVAALGYASVVIARPSLLLGDRQALGQPARFGEALATRLARPLGRLLPPGMRPIRAGDVARAIVGAVAVDPQPGLRVLTSAEMQPASRQAERQPS